MANAIPVISSKGKEPSAAAAPSLDKDGWKEGLSATIIAAVEAFGGPEDPRSKDLMGILAQAVNPTPTAGKVLKRMKLETHDAIREDH